MGVPCFVEALNFTVKHQTKTLCGVPFRWVRGERNGRAVSGFGMAQLAHPLGPLVHLRERLALRRRLHRKLVDALIHDEVLDDVRAVGHARPVGLRKMTNEN